MFPSPEIQKTWSVLRVCISYKFADNAVAAATSKGLHNENQKSRAVESMMECGPWRQQKREVPGEKKIAQDRIAYLTALPGQPGSTQTEFSPALC